jgi:hypothetical protein
MGASTGDRFKGKDERMPSSIDQRRSQEHGPAPTTLRWIGVGAAPTIEGIQSVTFDPDTAAAASEGAPEWLVTNGTSPLDPQ